MKYTLFELDALKAEFLNTLSNDYPDEWYEAPRQLHERSIEAFLVWLDQRNTGVPFKYRKGQVIKARCADGVVRENCLIIKRRKTETDSQPCYLVQCEDGAHHVEEGDIY